MSEEVDEDIPDGVSRTGDDSIDGTGSEDLHHCARCQMPAWEQEYERQAHQARAEGKPFRWILPGLGSHLI